MHSKNNPFAFRKPITLGNLDELFAHHRSLTSGWSMEDPPAPPAPPAPPKPADPPAYTPPATQEDLDRIVGDRLARERAKYADYDDLVKIKAERDAELEAAKTEHEKAVDAARKDGEKSATDASNARMVAAEARAQAAQAGFRSLSDVALADLSKVKVGEDGTVDVDAIKAELKKISDAEPWRLDDGKKPAPKKDPSQGGGGGEPQPGSAGLDAAQRRFATAKKS